MINDTTSAPNNRARNGIWNLFLEFGVFGLWKERQLRAVETANSIVARRSLYFKTFGSACTGGLWTKWEWKQDARKWGQGYQSQPREAEFMSCDRKCEPVGGGWSFPLRKPAASARDFSAPSRRRLLGFANRSLKQRLRNKLNGVDDHVLPLSSLG